MATYKPIQTGPGSAVDGLPFGTFTDAQINGEQRALLMQAIGAGLYEVIPDPESEVVAVAAPVETPETGPLAPPTVYYNFVGGAQFWPGLPARSLTDSELAGDQRIEMWKAVAAGLYAPSEARLMTEEEGREARAAFEAARLEEAARLQAAVEAQANAEAEAAAETKAQAEREAAELAARLLAETERLAAIEKAKAEAAALVERSDTSSPPGSPVTTDDVAGAGQTPATTDENGGAAPATTESTPPVPKTPRARRGN